MKLDQFVDMRDEAMPNVQYRRVKVWVNDLLAPLPCFSCL